MCESSWETPGQNFYTPISTKRVTSNMSLPHHLPLPFAPAFSTCFGHFPSDDTWNMLVLMRNPDSPCCNGPTMPIPSSFLEVDLPRCGTGTGYPPLSLQDWRGEPGRGWGVGSEESHLEHACFNAKTGIPILSIGWDSNIIEIRGGHLP